MYFLLAISASMCFTTPARAVDYYVSPAGDNTTGTSWDTAMTTISAGVALMSASGGDTVWIRNGTYTGIENVVDSTVNDFASGVPGAYNTIRAEEDFGVTIDMFGEDQRGWVGNKSYIVVRGIIFRGTRTGDIGWDQGTPAFQFTDCSHCKGIRLIGYDGSAVVYSGGNDSAVFAMSGCSDCLFEECVAFGNGHYSFVVYASDRSVLRRCVARKDVWAGGVGGTFQNYNSTNTSFQNCIALDYDEPRHWHADGSDATWGGFGINGNESGSVEYLGCIAMNVKGPNGQETRDCAGGVRVHRYNPGFFLNATDNVSMSNCAVIDSTAGVMTYGPVAIDHCSFVGITADITQDWDGLGVVRVLGDAPVVSDSVFYSAADSATDGIAVSSDYNAYYANANNFRGSAAGANDLCVENGNEIDVTASGLSYPVRIETGSSLKTAGTGGGQIGAEIVYRYGLDSDNDGISGLLYGEEGYNTLEDGADATDRLWPFPNETVIRAQMRSYVNADRCDPEGLDKEVNSTRGFCADGMTLTRYIWEHLGNPCPREVCGPLGSDGGGISSDGGVSPSDGGMPPGTDGGMDGGMPPGPDDPMAPSCGCRAPGSGRSVPALGWLLVLAFWRGRLERGA